ncbi:DUF5018 domain-containing protein [Aquimarina sp. 2-A2]|uniref:DUF5018 domain-containing protein n=1 Tax=Aquimarina sp. 2-A2 TaxID=3382644 RepID=UPI00387F17B7
MKQIYSLAIFIITVISLVSCSSDNSDSSDSLEDIDNEVILSNENSITEFKVKIKDQYINGFIDDESSTILLEIAPDFDLLNLRPEVSISENASISPNVDVAIDLNNIVNYTVTAEDGSAKSYEISTFTGNLLKNPNGDNNGQFWRFDGETGIYPNENEANIFYVTANEGDFSPSINQFIEFVGDYSDKFILFIGNLTTEKVVEDSITRHPYLWAVQRGQFEADAWPYMQGMGHREGANVWEVVHGVHKLLPNVTGTEFQMSQGSMVGDPYDGTTCKFKNLEVRVFESEAAAKHYVAKIYKG